MAKARWGMPRLAHVLSAVLLGGVLLLVQVHSADAQTTDPYTGGTVTPPASCPTSPHIAIDPVAPVAPGTTVTITTTGITPNNPVNIFVDSVLTATGQGDANGTFVTKITAPPPPARSYMVCASAPPCAMVCIDPSTAVGSAVGGESTSGGASNAGASNGSNVLGNAENRGFARTDDSTGGSSVLGRSFARTGFELLPWLLAALACIAVGRKLERANRHPGRRQKFPRVGPPTIAGYERDDALVR